LTSIARVIYIDALLSTLIVLQGMILQLDNIIGSRLIGHNLPLGALEKVRSQLLATLSQVGKTDICSN
jgi:hypothetical protein